VTSITSAEVGPVPHSGAGRNKALLISLDNFALCIATEDTVLRVIRAQQPSTKFSLLSSVLRMDDDGEDSNSVQQYFGEVYPITDASPHAPIAPMMLLSSCGTAAICAPLLASSLDSVPIDTRDEEREDKFESLSVDDEPLKADSSDEPAEQEKSLSWLDDDEAQQREDFLTLLIQKNLPVPKGERDFHAARVYIDKEDRSV